MANLLYRASATTTNPTSTTIKNSPLTNLEVDANFKSLNDDLAGKTTAAAAAVYADSTAATQAIVMSIALG